MHFRIVQWYGSLVANLKYYIYIYKTVQCTAFIYTNTYRLGLFPSLFFSLARSCSFVLVLYPCTLRGCTHIFILSSPLCFCIQFLCAQNWGWDMAIIWHVHTQHKDTHTKYIGSRFTRIDIEMLFQWIVNNIGWRAQSDTITLCLFIQELAHK